MNDGMCNICELLINVVSDYRLNVLTSLGQKARGMAGVLLFHPT